MANRKQNLSSMTDEQLLDMRMCDLKLSIDETPLERRIEQLNEELLIARSQLPTSFLAQRRLVFARRGPGSRDSVLLGPSPVDAAGAQTIAGGRGRHARLVHENPATRSRPCHRHGLPASSQSKVPRAFWQTLGALSRIITSRRPPVAITCCTWKCGTLNPTRWRILPRRLRFGCVPVRAGEPGTVIGRRCGNWNSLTIA